MDRKKKRVNYMTGASRMGVYGMNDKNKKKKKKPLINMRLIVGLIASALLITGVIAYSLVSPGRTSIGRATRIGATLNQNVEPFRDSIIFYDGTTLYSVTASGKNKWSYQIGVNGDYDVNEERIVAWSGDDLYIIDAQGTLVFNDKMNDTIQFASAGKEYVAAFIGDADNGVITVINSEGQIVDNVTIQDQTLLDIGFFYSTTSSSSAVAVELMWVLGIDTTGTVISTELQTFQPGKLATGKSSLGEHVAYRIYPANGMLNIVDTRQIMHYNYRALEQEAPTLIYGYTMEDVKTVGGMTYQLLIPAQDTAEGNRIHSVRLMAGSRDRVLHLPSECLATTLGTRSVYAFSQNAVYVCRYGETSFVSHALPVNITGVLGMITDNRVIVSSGSEIYVIELPE